MRTQGYEKLLEHPSQPPSSSDKAEGALCFSALQASLNHDIERAKEILKAKGGNLDNHSYTHKLLIGVIALVMIVGAASVLAFRLTRLPAAPEQSRALNAAPSVLPILSPEPTVTFKIRSVNFHKRTYRASEGAIRGDGKNAQIKVSFGDLTGDDVEEAAVLLNYGGGGSGWFSEVFVYGVNQTGKGVSEIAVIPGGDRANGGVKDALIRAGQLRVRTYEGSCNACPEFLITTVYAVNEQQHRQISQSKKPISDW
jgi:hypothetical protein